MRRKKKAIGGKRLFLVEDKALSAHPIVELI